MPAYVGNAHRVPPVRERQRQVQLIEVCIATDLSVNRRRTIYLGNLARYPNPGTGPEKWRRLT